ncbi:uncharacterized protein LOC123430807 [Hordeum vulgare subsp. vulgare]|uniref:GIR1-like zinc ribbon domain-containing protein n=1 Tax=Hordeum vulgare subsp. vulgare TaxID=112509 RepID=A0A8I6WI07_HORVV|nr:uncharacterized protein LOC123430807 [Hordeum vulgare subsp. vulgare]
MVGGEMGKGDRSSTGKEPEMGTMDLLSGCGDEPDREDEVVDVEINVPAGWDRRLDLLTFRNPHRHQVAQDVPQDLKLPTTASTTPAVAAVTTYAAVYTIDMVRNALQCAAARSARSPDMASFSSASNSSPSSALGKRTRLPPSSMAPPTANLAMHVVTCPSCLMYVLIAETEPRCPRCASKVPLLSTKPAANISGKKPIIDLNVAADDTE